MITVLERVGSTARPLFMCGICGRTDDRGGYAVRRMNDRMVARAPDDDGTYVDRDAGFALGARRLSILDVEGGHQPLSNEDGTVWAVLNGEIYNYPALRGRLLARGHEFATGTDTEVLVHLYEDFGAELVHALEGMFAFAVWDTKRRRLLLARDRFGEKPLFYAERAGELTFASELNALSDGARLGGDLDRGGYRRLLRPRLRARAWHDPRGGIAIATWAPPALDQRRDRSRGGHLLASA